MENSSKSTTINSDATTLEEEFEVLSTPVKSDSDPKVYKIIRLKNGLQVCLISDLVSTDNSLANKNQPIGEKLAIAALTVNVGSFHDPEDAQGLAHFLEHMISMGTEKYPEENDFTSFLWNSGGRDNAFTKLQTTSYYFGCFEKYFPTALDKFSQFFISPLTKKNVISREIEAVESEFQMAMSVDELRLEQLLASFAKKGSPVNKFRSGNLASLKKGTSDDDIYNKLHSFRRRHYSANRMALVLQAQLPLNVLQDYALKYFKEIPSNRLPPENFSQFTNIFDTSEFKTFYYVEPTGDTMQLHLIWSLPQSLNNYKSKPLDYANLLFENRGEGSIFAYLRKRIWILSLEVEVTNAIESSLYAMVHLILNLTQAGLTQVYKIIETICSYINMLRTSGVQLQWYNELKLVKENSYKFNAESDLFMSAISVSESMLFYPPEHCVFGGKILLENDPAAVQLMLNSLTVDNMNVQIWCNSLPPGLTFDRIEKWFGTRYAQQDVPQQWLQKWREASNIKEFTLPRPNPFLAQDFTILEGEDNHFNYPEKILESDLVELWYRKDQKFKLPTAYFKFYFMNPMVSESTKNAALLKIYVEVLKYLLDGEVHPSNIISLMYELEVDKDGIVIYVSGFNEKLHVIIELIIDHLLNYETQLNEEVFNAVKSDVIRDYYNEILSPDQLDKDTRKLILRKRHFSICDLHNVASSITFEEIKTFSQNFIKKLFVKGLTQGNITKDHAINVANNITELLKYKPIENSAFENWEVMKLPKGESFCVIESFDIKDSNSYITNYYQCGSFSHKLYAILNLIQMLIQDPMFDTLRTKEQLAYFLESEIQFTNNILGLSITINAQATNYTTYYVDKRIENFNKQISKILKNMSAQKFENAKSDLMKQTLTDDLKLKDEFERNWKEILRETYMFNIREQEIEEIKKLKLEDVQEWWEENTPGGNKTNFKKLSIQVAGFKNADKNHQEQKNQEKKKLILKHKVCERGDNECEHYGQYLINDIAEFKENLEVYTVNRKVHHQQ